MSHQLGDLQLAIMKVLWSHGRATVAQVHEALRDERGLALTTIATMLRKLEDKGVVTHDVDGRQFIYQPTVSEDEVSRSMVDQLAQRLFGGDTAALVNHLLTEREIDADELATLQTLIDRKRREAKTRDER